MNTCWKYWSCLVLILFVSMDSTAQKKGVKPEVRDYIDRKVSQYAERKQNNCLERAREEAERRVDSLLKSLARQQGLDTFPRPEKPNRPRRPSVEFPRDTRPIRPILDSPDRLQRPN